MLVEVAGRFRRFKRYGLAFCFALAKTGSIGIGFLPFVVARTGFARARQVDDLGRQDGPIICSGRTTRSKVSASTKPRRIASSFSVVPFLCAVLATVVALS